MLSNQETEHPIQEFSTSPPPHARALAIRRKEAERALLANRLSGRLGEPSFIYVSPSIYFVRFPLLDKSGKKTKSIFVELRSARVVDNPRVLREPGFPEQRKRNPYWESLSSELFNKGKGCFSYIKNVPVFPFFISSHPTAAAMVLGYWGLKRLKEPAKPFIGELANHIRTWGCGRREEVLELARGIKAFSALRGYRVPAREWVKRSTNPEEQMTFEDYQQEINAGRPVVISFMHQNQGAQNLYAAKRYRIQTCVAGVGYLSDSSGRFIVAHEGFFFGEEIPEQGTSGNPWSRPGVSFYNWESISSNMILVTVSKPERF